MPDPPPPLDEDHLEILRFAAGQRLFTAAQAIAWQELPHSPVLRRLKALERHGLLGRHEVFRRQPAGFTITRAGLRLVGERMSAPRPDLATYAHDLGVAWLHIAASRGAFGPIAEVVPERRLRSGENVLAGASRGGSEAAAELDAAATAPPPLAVRIGGVGPGGRPRLHYPDLVLVTPEGRHVAVELELTGKGQARREAILRGYAGDARFDAVLYLIERESVGRPIAAAARRMGMERIVHVQGVSWAAGRPGLDPAGHRAARSPRAKGSTPARRTAPAQGSAPARGNAAGR